MKKVTRAAGSRVCPIRHRPVPASRTMTSSPARTSTQLVLPPTLANSGLPVARLPRTPQKRTLNVIISLASPFTESGRIARVVPLRNCVHLMNIGTDSSVERYKSKSMSGSRVTPWTHCVTHQPIRRVPRPGPYWSAVRARGRESHAKNWERDHPPGRADGETASGRQPV